MRSRAISWNLLVVVVAITAVSCSPDATESVIRRPASAGDALKALAAVMPDGCLDSEALLQFDETTTTAPPLGETAQCDDDPPRSYVVRLAAYEVLGPERYGGLWVDHEGGGYAVAFVGERPSWEDVPGVTTLVRRDKSLEELKGIVAELGSQGISSVEREMDGWVEANLALDQEETAASLLAEHGEYIRIGLGQQEGSGVPYPPDPAYMAQICEPPAQTDTPSITATAAPGTVVTAVRGGEIEVTLEYQGEPFADMTWGTPILPLYKPGSDAPAAVFTGFIQLGATTGPGTRSAVVGVVPCDLTNGYLLAPGAYEVRGPVEGSIILNAGTYEQFVVYFDPITVTVTD